MLSTCTGNKKAVLIALDYEDTENEVYSCIGDTWSIRIELDLVRGFPKSNIRIYTDVDDNHGKPTRDGIINAMKWLTRGANANDSLFFLFSGHGGRQNGESYIRALDWKKIYSSELRRYLVDSLPAGCRLTTLFNCCKSGNILDLPYSYYSPSALQRNAPRFCGTNTSVDVVCFSSADDNSNAFTPPVIGEHFLENTFVANDTTTYNKLYSEFRQAAKSEETPMLAASHRLNGDTHFKM